MARIADLLAAGRTYSFEFFPPRTPEAEAVLRDTLVDLAPLAPSFVSVTYGAGGTTRERTHDLVVSILEAGEVTPMAHLTCAGHTRAELVDILERYRVAGVENVLALGGDPPAELGLPRGELAHADELVDLAGAVGGFSVGVAAFPEGHPGATDPTADLDHTAAKLGRADFAITQFFFEARHWVRLVDELGARGVDRPVVPGIMPVTNVAQVERMAQLSGSEFPAWLADLLHDAADPAEVRRIGIDVATQLCADLLDAGAPGLHFYTLNRSTATREIYAKLGLSGR